MRKRKVGSSKTLVDISKAYFEGHLCESDTISHVNDIQVESPLSYDHENDSLNSLHKVKECSPHVSESQLQEFFQLVSSAK